jgi:hypothetical protein
MPVWHFAAPLVFPRLLLSRVELNDVRIGVLQTGGGRAM